MALLARLYSRRIVNINVNIVLAGLLAMGPTALVAHLTHYIPGLKHPMAITGIILVADAFFDVMIYYLLHWLANHYPKHREGGLAEAGLSFIRDASLVQFERTMLIPVFYGTTAGLSWWLLHHNTLAREWTTVISLLCGITVTRIVHTTWMLRQERLRARNKAVASPAQAEPGVTTPAAPEAPQEPAATPSDRHLASRR